MCGRRVGEEAPAGIESLVFLQQVLKVQYNHQKVPVGSVSSPELQPEPSKHHPWHYGAVTREKYPQKYPHTPVHPLSSPHSGCPLSPGVLCRQSPSCAGVLHPWGPLRPHWRCRVGFWIKQCSFSIRCAL